MSISRWPTENEINSIFGRSLSNNVVRAFFFSALQFIRPSSLPIWGFNGIPVCACTSVSVSICVSCAFSLAYFLVWLFFHILICFSFILLLFLRCLFVSQLEPEVCGSRWKGRWNCEKQGWRNCSQNILYEKNVVSIKEK